MKIRSIVVVFTVFTIFTSYGLWLAPNHSVVSAQNDPQLYYGGVNYYDENRLSFDVYYQDLDGDDGTVWLYIDDDAPIEMLTFDLDPSQEQYYEILVDSSNIVDDTEFYFSAEDINGTHFYLYDEYGAPFLVGNFLGWGEMPILSNPDVYYNGDDWVFNVTYQDPDGDEAEWITLHLDELDYNMDTMDPDPLLGQNFFITVLEDNVDKDNSEFYFTTVDINGSYTELYDTSGDSFVVGDFIGGAKPVLSEHDVYLEDNYVVFEVKYQDIDGDEGFVDLYLDDSEDPEPMATGDPNPTSGQIFKVYIPRSKIKDDTEFYFYANDLNDGETYLNDDGVSFIVGNLRDEGQDPGIFAGWFDNPEVVVAIIGFLLVGAGSGYAAFRRKKKRGRFSELLEELDEIYRSFKTHPHKCETELEKMKGVIKEDLKQSTIDENNYSILKERIDEIMLDIRSENLQSQVQDLPKDIELRIKDMLIDGKITRDEYDKILPLIKGSDMAVADKEKMQKELESWVEGDKKKVDE